MPLPSKTYHKTMHTLSMHKSEVLLTIISYDSLRVANVPKEAAKANKKQVKHTHSINMYVYVCEKFCKQQT